MVFHGEYLAMYLKLVCLETTTVDNRTVRAKNNLKKTGQLTTGAEPKMSKMQSRGEFTKNIKVA